MKKLTFLAVALIVIASSCKKDEKSPTPGTPAVTASLTSFETQLLGKWNLKRTEDRGTYFLAGLGDSLNSYMNHYNYLNSMFEFTSTSAYSFTGSPQYLVNIGTDDLGPPYSRSWNGGSANTITINSVVNYFVVKYLTTDSLVLDFGGPIKRYCFNKSTVPPVQNNVETLLVGGWQLTSAIASWGDVTPTQPTFRSFYSTPGSGGYIWKDSVPSYVIPGTTITSPEQVCQGFYQVLFPNRTIPIYKGIGGCGTGAPTGANAYCKITNLTATSLTLEMMANPAVNSTTSITYTYTR